jgi:hypothetical protein
LVGADHHQEDKLEEARLEQQLALEQCLDTVDCDHCRGGTTETELRVTDQQAVICEECGRKVGVVLEDE